VVLVEADSRYGVYFQLGGKGSDERSACIHTGHGNLVVGGVLAWGWGGGGAVGPVAGVDSF
jgi:hypothetical protein